MRARVRDAPALHIQASRRGWSAVGGSGRSQLKSMSGEDRALRCGHVKLSTQNSADYLEFPDRGMDGEGLAQQALHSMGSALVNASIQTVGAKFILKKI